LDETGKTDALCHSMCGTIKINPYSKAMNAEQRPLEMVQPFTGSGDVSIDVKKF
jgi:hypothetical protein